jgi:ubiquinone/menaquinone biosynthesis C-methylase UbiE
MSFYDDLAGVYDELTGQADRAGAIRQFRDELLRRYHPQRVLDAACGTGAYSRALAAAGVEVTGADLSAGQLERADQLAAAEGVEVKWVQAAFDELAGKVPGPFDLALCMGNSLVHVMDQAGLAAAVDNFLSVLAPGGHLLTTNLNYERICTAGERIVGVHRAGPREYVRFYDFLSDTRIAFNVLQIDWSDPPPDTQLHTTHLRPWRPNQLRAAMEAGGFEQVEAFGGLGFGPFDPGQSDVLLLTARRAG